MTIAKEPICHLILFIACTYVSNIHIKCYGCFYPSNNSLPSRKQKSSPIAVITVVIIIIIIIVVVVTGASSLLPIAARAEILAHRFCVNWIDCGFRSQRGWDLDTTSFRNTAWKDLFFRQFITGTSSFSVKIDLNKRYKTNFLYRLGYRDGRDILTLGSRRRWDAALLCGLLRKRSCRGWCCGSWPNWRDSP